MKTAVNYEQMQNCFLFNKNKNECEGLHYMYCKKEGRCSFYKPKEKKVK